MFRRDLLRGGAAAALAAATSFLSTEAAAGAGGARFRGAERSELGTTLDLAPRAAPYPLPGRPWSDSTVLAFVPAGHRTPASGAVDIVTFFHGHNTTARDALAQHQLREQLVESRQNAILVVPQGPVRAGDGDFGKLMGRGGLARLLEEVRALATAKSASDVLPADALTGAQRVGRVIVAGHSGGYRATAACLARGGCDTREAWLFDALYDETETFADWVASAARGRKLVSFAVGGVPLRRNRQLAALLQERGVPVAEELPSTRLSRTEMVKARAIVAQEVASHPTAVFEESSFRDCLIASCLRGRGSAIFFKDGADKPRRITRRPTGSPKPPA